jgi:hypothetical protein
MAERTMRIYGALDLIFAWVYLLSFIYAVPPYSQAIKVAVYVVCIIVMIGGLGLILARRWGYWLGLAAAGVLMAVCVFTVLTLVASAAYLHGLYGAFGKGATYITLFAISVVIAYFGLLPGFQLHGLLKKEVRQRFFSKGGQETGKDEGEGEGQDRDDEEESEG